MKVFLDANVLFSAAMAGSATRGLLDAVCRHAEAVTNEHAWEEAQRNLARKRPLLAAELQRLRVRVRITTQFRLIGLPEVHAKDQPILGGAVASGCSHLWAGDKRHFGPLYGKVVLGTRIVSGVMLADELDRVAELEDQ